MISSTRAESTQLSHLFGIAMTAILITVVLTGGADYVDDQRADVAEQQLETIGNRLASELERVDELGQEGARATVRTRVQARVSGENYDVNVSAGDACRTENFDADRCLVLETVDGDASATVPLNVSSDLSLEQEGGGVLLLGVAGSGDREGTATVVDRQLRIGVARDFESNRFGSVTDPTNRPPVAKVDFSPGNPRSSDPVRFSAAESFDPDGTVVTYKWDFDGDGSFDALGRNVSRNLAAGPQRVKLQVVDNEGALTNATAVLRVSGVAYEGDLGDTDEGTGNSEGAISFSVTNEWATDADSSIEITHVLIEPKWDNPTELGHPIENDCGGGTPCPYGSASNDEEVVVDAGLDGGEAEGIGPIDHDPDRDGETEIADSGVIVELDEPVSLFSGESARIWVGAFEDETDLSGREFDLGVRYEVDGKRNSTTFTDVAGSPNIETYRLETGADNEDVEAVIVSDKELDTIRIDLGGDLSGTEDESGVTTTERPDGRYEHRLFLGSLPDGGVAKANLTVAENDSVPAFETRGSKSINRSFALLDGEYVWSSTADWDNSFAWDGVVHDSVGSRQPDTIRLGYPTSSEFGSSLAGYWHFDGSAEDASGNGLDGTESGVGTGFGVFGTPSYSFGSGDHVEVPGIDGIHSGTSSLSTWIRTSSEGDDTFWAAPGITGVEETGGGNDIFWGWIDGTGQIGVQAGDDSGSQSPTAVDDGQWHHVVLTYRASDGNSRVFVDGELVDEERTATGGTTTPFSSIGRIEDTGGTTDYFNGQIDEVRSYDRVLTSDEAEDLAEPNGTIRTGWKNGSTALDASQLSVQYSADIPIGTAINVTVHADTSGDGSIDRTSDTVTLEPGRNSVPVEGFGSFDASRYKLVIDLKTVAPTKTPVVYQIGVTEDS